MKFIKWLAWFIVALFILIPSVAVFLVATESGSRWLVTQTLSYFEAPVSVAAIDGRIMTGLTLNKVELQSDGQLITIQRLTFTWQPWDLFERKVTINELIASSVHIQRSPQVVAEANAEPVQIPTVDLPVLLTIDDLQITQLRLDDEATVLESIATQLRWQGTELRLAGISVGFPQGKLTGDLELSTTADLDHELQVNWLVDAGLLSPELEPYGEVTGELNSQGNLQTTQITGSFRTDVDEPIQQFTATVETPLTALVWAARFELDDFRTSPLLAFVPSQYREQADYYLRQSRLSGVIDANQESLQLQAGTLSDVSPARGSVTVSGQIQSLFDATVIAPLKPFSFQLTGQAIRIANASYPDAHVETIAAKLVGEWDTGSNGSETHYQFDLTSRLAGIDADPADLTIQGDGDLAGAHIELFKIEHPLLLARGSSTLVWTPSLSIEAELTELKGVIQAEEIVAAGYVLFDGNKLVVRDTSGSWAGIQFTAQGELPLAQQSMITTSPLEMQLTIADFSRIQDLLQADATLPLEGSLDVQLAVQPIKDGIVPIAIDVFNLSNPEVGDWTLSKNAVLEFDQSNSALSSPTPLCIQRTATRTRNGTTATLCSNLTTGSDHYQLSLDAQNLPLYLLNRLRERDVSERIAGRANIEATVKLARANFKIMETSGSVYSDSTIFVALDDEFSTRLEIWDIDWVGTADELKTTYIVKLEDDLGQLIGDLTIRDLLSDPQLTGSVDMALRDLSLLQWWLPDLRYREPFALGSLAISGSASAPMIEGSLEVAAAEIGFAESGLVLTDVKVAIADEAGTDNVLMLDGQAESGKGWIAIGGTLNPLAKSLDMTIKGDGFRVIQLPNATVDINPDIAIKAADSRIDITGNVHIPYAYLEETDISSSVSPSRDVVIYRDGERVQISEEQLYQVFADVRVTLGKDVKVSAFGFEGRLDGSLRLIEQPGRSLTASGTIQVPQGQYVLYGQELEIQRGRLIYNGGPLDNPGLDLRVVRTSASMTPGEEVTVGAQVGGTLIQPDFRLFSNPSLPESSILSYLVMGRGPGAGSGNENMQLQALLLLGSKGTDAIGSQLQDVFGFDEFGLDSSSDPTDTSFYIGKYLSPRLYVKYGVGLFENTNTFFVRYKLTEHLLIESTASSLAQGGDIFYSIEK